MADEARPAVEEEQEEVLIRFKDVHKSFGQHHVLKGVTFDVTRGGCLGIMGGSGTGKSVMLRHAIGLLKADSGEVWVKGRDMSRISRADLFEMRKSMGYVFQEGALINWLTVEENLALPLQENTKLGAAEIRDKVAEKLELVSTPEALNKMPSEISGGMKKRVGLARALIDDPEIILYDEPNAGLDPQIARSINELMREVSDRLNVTSIVVEHRVECLKAVADEVIFMYGGQAHVRAPTAEFFQPTDPKLREFLGA